MFEVRIDRIVEIETAQRRLEADQLIAKRSGGQSSSPHSHSQDEFRLIRDDHDDLRRKLRRLKSFPERQAHKINKNLGLENLNGNGNDGNGNGVGNGGNENHNDGNATKMEM
nr:hypothetical protein [Tanacetum cinerariifolium]